MSQVLAQYMKRLSISAYWGNAEILESSIWGADRRNRDARRPSQKADTSYESFDFFECAERGFLEHGCAPGPVGPQSLHFRSASTIRATTRPAMRD